MCICLYPSIVCIKFIVITQTVIQAVCFSDFNGNLASCYPAIVCRVGMHLGSDEETMEKIMVHAMPALMLTFVRLCN